MAEAVLTGLTMSRIGKTGGNAGKRSDFSNLAEATLEWKNQAQFSSQDGPGLPFCTVSCQNWFAELVSLESSLQSGPPDATRSLGRNVQLSDDATYSHFAMGSQEEIDLEPEATLFGNWVTTGDNSTNCTASKLIQTGTPLATYAGDVFLFDAEAPDASRKLRELDKDSLALDLTRLIPNKVKKATTDRLKLSSPDHLSWLLLPSKQSLGANFRFASKEEVANASIVAHPHNALSPSGPLQASGFLVPGALVVVADVALLEGTEILLARPALSEAQQQARDDSSLIISFGSDWAPSIYPAGSLLRILDPHLLDHGASRKLQFARPDAESEPESNYYARYPLDLQDMESSVKTVKHHFSQAQLAAYRQAAVDEEWLTVSAADLNMGARNRATKDDYLDWFNLVNESSPHRHLNGALPLPSAELLEKYAAEDDDKKKENRDWAERVASFNRNLGTRMSAFQPSQTAAHQKYFGKCTPATFECTFNKYASLQTDSQEDPCDLRSEPSDELLPQLKVIFLRLYDETLGGEHFRNLTPYARGLAGFPIGSFFAGLPWGDELPLRSPSYECCQAWFDALRALLTSTVFLELLQTEHDSCPSVPRCLPVSAIYGHLIGLAFRCQQQLGQSDSDSEEQSNDDGSPTELSAEERWQSSLSSLDAELRARETLTKFQKEESSRDSEFQATDLAALSGYVQVSCEYSIGTAHIFAEAASISSNSAFLKDVNGYALLNKSSMSSDTGLQAFILSQVSIHNKTLHDYRRRILSMRPQLDLGALQCADGTMLVHRLIPQELSQEESDAFTTRMKEMNKQIRKKLGQGQLGKQRWLSPRSMAAAASCLRAGVQATHLRVSLSFSLLLSLSFSESESLTRRLNTAAVLSAGIGLFLSSSSRNRTRRSKRKATALVLFTRQWALFRHRPLAHRSSSRTPRTNTLRNWRQSGRRCPLLNPPPRLRQHAACAISSSISAAATSRN
jgi:hypothetical protein